MTSIDRVLARLRPGTARERAPWFGGATLIFSLFVLYCFRDLLRHDLTVTTLGRTDAASFRAWDQRYAIWAITRNARAFVHPSHPFFDSGQCFPAKHALALGHGVIALGLLAIPVSLLLQDPVLVYNVMFLALAISAPIAMYILVAEWTAMPLAGIVAGLVYGLHASKLGDPDQLYLTDTAWTVLLLLFMRRVFRGRNPLGSAVGFGLCTSAQLAAGNYPGLAGLLVGFVVLVGLAIENGFGRRLIAPGLVAGAIIISLGYAMYGPYLSFERHGALAERGQVFLPFASTLPGGDSFIGWMPLGLCVAGVALTAPFDQVDAPTRALRVALLAAAVVVLFLAIGGVFSAPTGIPFKSASGRIVMIPREPSALYRWLTAFVPGLTMARAPAFTYGGAHLCLSVLVGLGTAAVLDRAASPGIGRWRRALSLAVPVLTACSAPFALPAFSLVHARPDEEDLRFFETLAAKGNHGPLLEYPAGEGLAWWNGASEALLLSAYHRRATSQCFASLGFLSEDVKHVLDIAAGLPSPGAVDSVEQLGFTTLLAPSSGPDAALTEKLLGAAAVPGARLRLIARSRNRTAFELR